MTRSLLFVLVALVLGAVPASAQTPVEVAPPQPFYWDQPVSSGADLQLMTWQVTVDGAHVGAAVPPASCTLAPSGRLATCTAPIPAMTPGTHQITVRVTRTVNGTSATAESAAWSVTVYVLQAPTGLRLTQ